MSDLEERNRLAKECSDLRDALRREREDYVQASEAWAKQWAEELLAGGKTPAEVTEEVYDDTHKVLAALKNRLWWNGYLEGIRGSRDSLDRLLREEIKAQEDGQ